jgi:phosphate transport system protein
LHLPAGKAKTLARAKTSKRKRASAALSDSVRATADTVLRACGIARDAAFNARDYLETGSRMGFLAVQQCEKELDQIERQIDESTPIAITQVGETDARELLGCLKFTIDLERIGDLIWSVVKRVHHLPDPLNARESQSLIRMARTLEEMLGQIGECFTSRDLRLAKAVMKKDSEMDLACHAVFREHLADGAGPRSFEVTNLLFMAQALERAGDHTKNLAEEVFHLAEGHSIRHDKKSRSPSQA